MDRLRSIESSLPPEQPPTKQAINALETDLSQEFKNAANAVTKLYRVANERNSLTRHAGYIECIDDMLLYMQDTEGALTLKDMKSWLLKQRADRLSGDTKTNTTNNNNTNNIIGSDCNFNFKTNYTDNENNPMVSSPKFVLSMPPPSIQQQHNNSNASKKRATTRRLAKLEQINNNIVSTTTEMYDKDHLSKKPKNCSKK